VRRTTSHTEPRRRAGALVGKVGSVFDVDVGAVDLTRAGRDVVRHHLEMLVDTVAEHKNFRRD